MRLIDADALKTTHFYPTNTPNAPVLSLISLEAINDAPTIDAEPVRHGRWITYLYMYAYETGKEEDEWQVVDAEDDGRIAHCSLCGGFALLDGGEDYVHSKYCPHCGAKMDGGEGDAT